MAPFPAENSARDRSTSAGDSELAKHERKRPRLDNSHLVDPLSKAEALVSASNTPGTHPPLMPTDGQMDSRPHTPPALSQSSDPHESTFSPTSKVTINTRPMSAQSTMDEAHCAEKEVDQSFDETYGSKNTHREESPTIINISDTESSQTATGLVNQPISIPSSASASPASLADIEETQILDQYPSWHGFPYTQRDSQEEVVELIKNISALFEKGHEDSQFTLSLHGLMPFILHLPRVLQGRDFASIREDLDFFQTLPLLLLALLKRRLPIPIGITESDLLQFAQGFAQIVMSMIQIDITRLKLLQDSTPIELPPWLLSTDYLQRFTTLLQLPSSCNLHTALRTSRHIDTADFAACLAAGFLKEDIQKPFALLSDLFDEMIRTVPPNSHLRSNTLHLLVCYRITLTTIHMHKVPMSSEERDALCRRVSGFVLKAYAVLQEAIRKQHSWLTIENTTECVNIYVYLTKATILQFPELASEVFKMAKIPMEATDADEVVDHTSIAFRLALLKILIQQGRMELRVWATETMAQELVNVWGTLPRLPAYRSQPMSKLVVDFLNNNEIVSYILGVDSHPQIVSRSFNIIGFLCVSSQWHSQDSDVAWRAILQSQDHRSISAVIEVLKLNLQHLSIEASLYMYEKLHTVPADRFDNRMLDLTITLLSFTSQKYGRAHEHEHLVNFTMVGLCLHLLREVNVPSRCATEISGQIRDEIGNFMLVNRPSTTGSWYSDLTEHERAATWKRICQNVASHDEHATGSVMGMRAILHSLDKAAAGELVSTSRFTKLLLDDMLHLLQSFERGSAPSEDVLFIQYTVRIDCMFHLVCHVPQSFNEEMYQSLWNNVLGAPLPQKIRAYAWNMVANAYRNAGSSNSVLEFVASNFMQKLTPSSFDAAVLEFAQASVEYDIRTNFGRMGEVDQCLEMSSMERLWRIMLEAPDQSVEVQASNLIIKLCLDKSLLSRSSTVSVEKSQEALVDRCIRTVIESAQHLGATDTYDGLASLPPTEEQLGQHEIRLHRSLMLLRNFLDGLKTRPQFKVAPLQIIGPALRTFQRRGPPVALRLRILDHAEIRSDTISWIVGEDNAGHELWQFLTTATGWSQVNFIIGGGRMQLQGSQSTVRELKIGPTAVIASKAIGSTAVGVNRAMRSTSPVDSKIMHHFGELYALLESKENVAKAIYEFLTMFSSQEGIVTEIKSSSLPATSLLPVEKPFKLLYYATALRSCIEEESFSTDPNVDFLRYTVRTIIAALSNIQSIHADSQLFTAILHGIIETLLLGLRAKIPEATSSNYFTDPAAFTNDLLQSWKSVQSIKHEAGDHANQRALSRNFFDVMVEATLHEPRTWQYISQHEGFSDLLAFAILLNGDKDDRQSVRDVILRLTGTSVGKIASKTDDVRSPRGRFPLVSIENCLSNLWTYFYPLLQRACESTSTCPEFLEAAVAIFGIVSKKLDQASLTHCFADTRSLLLEQDYDNGVKRHTDEALTHGFAKIIYHCIVGLAPLNVMIPDGGDLIREIYRRFLFPPLSESADASLVTQRMPILDSNTRAALYDVVGALCQNEETLEVVAEEMADGSVDQDAFSAHTSNERKALRTDQGYAGIRNLSNTCYLNSLISQLFMNVKFREFIIGIEVTNENSQKLVLELASVFANMQSSYEKYVNPEEAVDSITQYSGEQIDVTIQMDVDEFFNLLFDRLESQIKDSDARAVFKSIYGGQLVQQIKSQECEHVSERLEPFSAVQVEIKGKSGLEEGLAAYVEGEVLQGENKYSCTSCGKHVNAVKRACLKEVPDNLIFNLKRFDYDIMTGMRCKVNDEFQFPDKVDMMPYTMDALSNPDQKHDPDIFELVGVIIHSGTAETGHYYSYIRQRPSGRPSEESWVQFNDHEVSKFEPKQLKDVAFGGCDQTFSALPKFYNGYMLFYQRAASVEAYAQEYPTFDDADQVQVALPRELDNRIAQENEICFRRYVAQDFPHAKFVRSMLERMRTQMEKCSLNHSLENNLLSTVLEYIHQVSSRWREAPEFEETIKVLCGYAKTCTKCALKILEWFNTDDNVLSCLLKAWYTLARKQFAGLLATCYAVMSPLRHPSSKEGAPQTVARQRLESAYTGCLKQIAEYWIQIQRYNRGWDNLFGCLYAIAQLGYHDAHMLIELGFLERCIEIIWIHHSPTSKTTPKGLRAKFNTYLVAREKGRQFNHIAVVDLFAELFSYVSLDGAQKQASVPTIALNDAEMDLLGTNQTGSLLWLKKLIAGRNSDVAIEAVIKVLCNYPEFQERTGEILVTGLLSTKSLQVALLFLTPCLVYVEHCPDESLVSDVIQRSLGAMTDLEGQLSIHFFDYIKQLQSLQTTTSGFNEEQITKVLTNNLGSWAPPLLMAPNDIHRDVRAETVSLIDELVLTPLNQFGDIDAIRRSSPHMSVVRSLVLECISYVNKNFLPSTMGGSQQPRETLFVGQARQMISILEHCDRYFVNDDADDEEVLSAIQNTVEELRLLEQNIDVDELEGWREQSSDQLSDQSFEMSMTPPPGGD